MLKLPNIVKLQRSAFKGITPMMFKIRGSGYDYSLEFLFFRRCGTN